MIGSKIRDAVEKPVHAVIAISLTALFIAVTALFAAIVRR